MNAQNADRGGVGGERDGASVIRVLSLQSRMSNLLAIGFMSILGLGALTWYYAHALMGRDGVKQSAQAAAARRAQGDLPLPSLGRIDSPPPAFFEPLPAVDQAPLAAQSLAEIPPEPRTVSAPPGTPPVKSAAELALERQLSGVVFAARGLTGESEMGPGTVTEKRGSGELAGLLQPTVTAAARAQVLPARRLLLPKGAFIDCTLETAIDSTLPGMTTCVMATDAFGVDGNVVLLERGTKLVGETRGQVTQGAARIFVLWTEARTPTGVVVPLDSPGADELGRSGLPGEVDRHFWQRFGAAMLVSVVNGAVQAASQSARGGGGAVVVNPSSSQDVLTEILKNTINIPPTVTKRNGDRIQVLVARDVDFRSVYELRTVDARR
jgi:type IV secretion system protein VirB10